MRPGMLALVPGPYQGALSGSGGSICQVLFALLMLAGLSWPTATAAPAATAEGETPGMRVEVQELRREAGGTVMLRLSIVNESDTPFNRSALHVAENLSVDGIYLLDLANRKKYEVVRDGQRQCVCTRNIPDHIKPRSSANFWAKFPAPPEGVTRMSVVVPRFMPLDDVPLSQ